MKESLSKEKCTRETGLAQNAEAKSQSFPLSHHPTDRFSAETVTQKRDNHSADKLKEKAGFKRPVFSLFEPVVVNFDQPLTSDFLYSSII